MSHPSPSHQAAAAPRGGLLPTACCLLALCLLSAAFFWKVIALGHVLLPGDVLYAHDPLWRSLAPRGFTGPANPLDSDELTEFYPWTVLAARALHQGVVPLWNPYAFAGTPFLAAMQTAVFYPINLILEWLVPPIDVLGPRAIMHLAIVLTGSFLFARRLGQSYAAAMLAALAFGLSAPYIVWIEHPIAGAVAWLPWILLCVDCTIATRGRARWAAATALALAVEMLAGHGESTAHVLLLCLAFGAFRALALPRTERVRPIAALALALTLGIGITAVQLLPALAQISISEAAADRALSPPTGLLGDASLWKTLLVAAVPDYDGNPTWGVTLLPDTIPFNEAALYTGAVTLFLAAAAVMLRRDRDTVFFGAIALVALGIAVRLPILGLFNDLPVLRVANNGRLRLEYAFAVALLAGYGLDALMRGPVPPAVWRVTRLWWLAMLVLVVLAVVGLLEAHPYGRIVPLSTAAWAALPAVWLSLFIGALWPWRHGTLPVQTLRWLGPALVALDLFAHGASYHTTMPRAQALAIPPAVRVVERDHSLYRIVGLGETLMPSLSTLYELQDVRGYDPIYAAAYERYFDTIFSARSGMRLGLAARPLSAARQRALDLMNVAYLFVACDKSLNSPGYHLIYHGSGCVYRNDAAMPRAVLVHRVAWASPARAVTLLGRGIIDPRSVALLDPATADHAEWRSAPGTRSQDMVRVAYDDLNDVTISVSSRRRGVLVLTDAYAPGWQARVDGRPAPIARADAVFRAIPVGPGEHTVQLTYRPEAFSLGVVVSAASCALWALLALASVATRRRRSRPLAAGPAEHV